MRLFVAIALPDDIRERLNALQSGLPGARWVPEENLHLTLRFIGEVDGRQAQDIDAALTGVRTPSFSIALAGLDSFSAGAKIRSLWARVEPNEPLKRLQAKVEQAVQRAGLPAEGRKFKPHVTLARFNGSNPGARVCDFLSLNGLFRLPPFEVNEFTLFSSFLSQSGAIYRAEAQYPLAHTLPSGEVAAAT